MQLTWLKAVLLMFLNVKNALSIPNTHINFIVNFLASLIFFSLVSHHTKSTRDYIVTTSEKMEISINQMRDAEQQQNYYNTLHSFYCFYYFALPLHPFNNFLLLSLSLPLSISLRLTFFPPSRCRFTNERKKEQRTSKGKSLNWFYIRNMHETEIFKIKPKKAFYAFSFSFLIHFSIYLYFLL